MNLVIYECEFDKLFSVRKVGNFWSCLITSLHPLSEGKPNWVARS